MNGRRGKLDEGYLRASVGEVKDKRIWFTRRAERAPNKLFSWATYNKTEEAASSLGVEQDDVNQRRPENI